MCSFSRSPVPMPNVKRPSASSCVVAVACARTAGWIRVVGHVTAVVRCTDVVAASAPSTLQTNGLSPWDSSQGW